MAKTFKDIIAWQKAHELVKKIYLLTGSFPYNEMFGLVSQMRRSVVSVATNIVEGFARKNKKESLNFYNYANASLEELKYQSLLANHLNYIKNIEYCEFVLLSDEVGKTLNGWTKSQH